MLKFRGAGQPDARGRRNRGWLVGCALPPEGSSYGEGLGAGQRCAELNHARVAARAIEDAGAHWRSAADVPALIGRAWGRCRPNCCTRYADPPERG